MARRKPPEQQTPEQKRECIEFSDGPSLHVHEDGIGATFTNSRRKELRKIKYDKCYYRASQGGRADYIVGYDRAIDVILELKGSDLKHARTQVADTLDRWRNDRNRHQQIVCLIVFGHTIPRMRSNLGVLELEFLEEHGTYLRIRQNGEKFNFNRLAGKIR